MTRPHHLALALLFAPALSGCSLVLSFDESKIPGEDTGTSADAQVDSAAPPTDVGTDATDSTVADAADSAMDSALEDATDAAAVDSGDAVADSSDSGDAVADSSDAADAPEVCVPSTTCTSAALTCGSVSNGCGVTLDCNNATKDGTETDVDCGGGGACATKCGQGKLCGGDGDCASGHCVDGVCCDTACTGICQACSAAKKGGGVSGVCGAIALGSDPDSECTDSGAASCGTSGACNGAGACAFYSSSTICRVASCTGGSKTSAASCVGDGSACPAATTTSCGNFTCNLAGTDCLTSCAADVDCVGTAYCKASSCVPKLTAGMACVASNECVGGHCVDGVCCNTACTGTCQSCNVIGSVGTCSNVPVGASDPGSCTSPSTCDGAGACTP